MAALDVEVQLINESSEDNHVVMSGNTNEGLQHGDEQGRLSLLGMISAVIVSVGDVTETVISAIGFDGLGEATGSVFDRVASLFD